MNDTLCKGAAAAAPLPLVSKAQSVPVGSIVYFVSNAAYKCEGIDLTLMSPALVGLEAVS